MLPRQLIPSGWLREVGELELTLRAQIGGMIKIDRSNVSIGLVFVS